MTTTYIKKPRQESAVLLRAVLMGLVGLDLLLLGIGAISHPSALSGGIIPALLIQGIYGLSAWFGLKGIHDSVEIHFSLIFGLLIAIVFGSEIIIELLVTVNDNTPLANAEFGTVFVLLFITGLATAWRSGSVQSGIKASVWSALLGSLAWYAIVLLTYYLFRTTPHQQQAFVAEGTFEDFHRSGMTDFEAFVLQDFWGAGFFHLMFAPFFALMLGGAGTWIGWMARHLWRHPSNVK